MYLGCRDLYFGCLDLYFGCLVVPDNWYPKFLAPGTRQQAPCRYQAPGTRYLPGTRHLVPGWFQVPGWSQVPGAKHLVRYTSLIISLFGRKTEFRYSQW